MSDQDAKPDEGQKDDVQETQAPPNDPTSPDPQTPASDPPKESPVNPPDPVPGEDTPEGKSDDEAPADLRADRAEPWPEENATAGVMKGHAKPVAKPKPRAKAKPAAKAKPKPRAKSLAERHADAAEKARAEVKAASKRGKAKDAPKRADDPDLRTAHEATALATGGSVSKDGALTVGEVKFGAAVNTTQIRLMREQVKGKNILQMLGGVSEAALRRYAKGECKATDLPEGARKGLKELNGKFPPKLKMWPRKDAAILCVINAERKRSSKKPTETKAKETGQQVRGAREALPVGGHCCPASRTRHGFGRVRVHLLGGQVCLRPRCAAAV